MFHSMRRMSWLGELLSASREVSCVIHFLDEVLY